jgi:outer membrane protein assembly factor BamC
MLRFVLVTSLVLAVAGCSFSTRGVLPDKSVEYKREKQAERSLEVPPDLTSSDIGDQMAVPGSAGTSFREFEGQQRRVAGNRSGGTAVLPEVQNVEVLRDGDERWLIIQAAPEAVWPKVVEFWQSNGILLQQQDPTVGIMQTAWLENRADIKQDFITDAVRSVFDGLYEAGTRDQYRVRLERGAEPGTTELYLTHFGMEEELAVSPAGETEQSVWIPRGRDPGLEAVMLRRLMVFLGESTDRADQLLATGAANPQDRTRLIQRGDATSLLINESFSQAWRLAGLALDRVGFAVEDRDRSSGIYYVRYNDPAAAAKDEGWLSKLAFWSDNSNVDKKNRYQVKVSAIDVGSEVTVQDEQGNRLNTPTANRILTLLHEQLR